MMNDEMLLEDESLFALDEQQEPLTHSQLQFFMNLWVRRIAANDDYQ